MKGKKVVKSRKKKNGPASVKISADAYSLVIKNKEATRVPIGAFIEQLIYDKLGSGK
jgi:hypothetical protein